VLVENAGHGGAVSAPIAGELIRAYFSPDEPEPAQPAKRDSSPARPESVPGATPDSEGQDGQ
jgi:hypothetical protein